MAWENLDEDLSELFDGAERDRRDDAMTILWNRKRIENRAYYLENQRRLKAKRRKRYRADPAADLERCQKYRDANREKMAAYHRAYRARNKERIAARDKAYRQAKPRDRREYFKLYNAERKSR